MSCTTRDVSTRPDRPTTPIDRHEGPIDGSDPQDWRPQVRDGQIERDLHAHRARRDHRERRNKAMRLGKRGVNLDRRRRPIP